MSERHHRGFGWAAMLLGLSASTAVAQQPPAAAENPQLRVQANTRSVDMRRIPTDQLRLLKPEAVERIRPDLHELTLQPKQLLARRLPGTAQKTTTVAGKERWELPYQIVGVDAEGTTLDLQPLVEIDGGGLRPQGAGGFLGRIFMAVRDANSPSQSRTLDPPIEMLVTAEVDQVRPHSITLAKTNSFTEIQLQAASPRNPVRVRILPSFDPDGTEIQMPVLRGSLVLSASPKRIQGLGLETADITVRAADVPSPEGTVVTLSTDRGSLEERTLRLDNAGVASTTLRSVTVGTATVHAEAGTLEPGQTRLGFVLPWLFLGAALLGGGVGSLIRWARTPKKARRALWVEILPLGALVGVVVAAAYAIGINLTGFEPAARAGEALVFVLSAVGALFGVKSPTSGSD